MSACINVDPQGQLYIDTVGTDCIYQVLETAEINQINGLSGLFAQYFDFDASLFALIVGGSLLAFASGHVLGRIMGLWRKGM